MTQNPSPPRAPGTADSSTGPALRSYSVPATLAISPEAQQILTLFTNVKSFREQITTRSYGWINTNGACFFVSICREKKQRFLDHKQYFSSFHALKIHIQELLTITNFMDHIFCLRQKSNSGHHTQKVVMHCTGPLSTVQNQQSVVWHAIHTYTSI